MVQRVLFISKFRSIIGGVETHLHDLIDELNLRGVETCLLTSEDLNEPPGRGFTATPRGLRETANSARSLLWNQRSRKAVRQKIQEFRPDVVHYQSISHQLSPSVLGLFDGPTVMTAHDYKLSAPCYTLVRDGELCTLCVGKVVPLNALRYRCVKGSLAGSALCVAEASVFGDRYSRSVDFFIVPSTYSASILSRSGVSSDSIRVVPWGVGTADEEIEGNTTPRQHPPKRETALYVGRLHPTKGVDVLVSAWRNFSWTSHKPVLRIAGDGELRREVEKASANDESIEYLGFVSRARVHKLLREASFLLMPSRAPETMGLSALEALAAGCPVLLSGRGALADLAGPGVRVVDDLDPQSWRDAVERITGDPIALNSLSDGARTRDLSSLSVGAMTDRILAVYAEATRNRQKV